MAIMAIMSSCQMISKPLIESVRSSLNFFSLPVVPQMDSSIQKRIHIFSSPCDWRAWVTQVILFA